MHTWALQRRLGATGGTHGQRNSIRTNFGWVVTWGWHRCGATFFSADTDQRPAIAQKSLPVIFRKATRRPECVRWPGWCCTSGEHGPDGTSETVKKIGSNATEFFKPQKSNRKSPAAPQCCERLLQGCGAP